jgi:uncharacterized protein YndB with AHSA1/START domain
MSEYKIVQDYPHPPELVWRALTDPELVPRWTATGQGGRPVGFSTEVGTRFQLVGRPRPGWNGVVDCELLEARAPALLRYSWRGGGDDEVTQVACRLEPHAGGTRLTFEHTGFTGIGGYLVSRILASARKKMLRVGMPTVLDEIAAYQ